MASDHDLSLHCGDLSLAITPQFGGCILAFRQGQFDLMRSSAATAPSPGDTACFPLVPFSGRIDHAHFNWEGKSYTIPKGDGQPIHAIHGHGLKQAWQVDRQGQTSIHVSYHYDHPDWPFPYRAWQFFELGEDALIVTIGMRNEGVTTMPAGLGLHPYFNRLPGAQLTAQVDHVYLPDDTNIPRERAAVPADLDFHDRRPLAELEMDHNFGGWDQRARIEWRNEGKALDILADRLFSHLVVYVPPGQDFFCVEPVTHVADAVNRPLDRDAGTGLVSLAPGATLHGSVRFVPN